MYSEIDYSDDGGRSPVAQAEWLGEPHSGDFATGVGVSTSQLQNPNVSLGDGRSTTGASGPAWKQSLGIFVGILFVLGAIKFISEKAGEKAEFSTTRIGLENWLVNTFMVALGFYAFKTSANAASWMPGAWRQFWGAV